MATATSIAIRRDAAFERLMTAISALKGAEVDPFVPPKGADMREAALVEWAADQLEGLAGIAPEHDAVLEIATEWPKWYQKLYDKSVANGEPEFPVLYKGESQNTWKERVAAEAESEPETDLEEVELSAELDSDGNPVVVTESVDGEVPPE